MDNYVDKIITAILNPIFAVLSFIINAVFSNTIITTILYVLLVNLVGYILMKKDKDNARDGKWRIRESTLLITAIAGGSIGILAGMKKFHHKTNKPKFSIGIPIIIFLQIVYLIYVLITRLF
jgi:uncharacterized membrane protein YsdA (DUF1294 family)